MSDIFSNGDYQRIHALFTEYVWTFDQADLGSLEKLFTEDMVFEDTGGIVYQGRAPTMDYFRELVRRPSFRGRQHHIDNLRITPEAGGYLIRAYWTVTKWDTAANTKIFEVTGHSLDRMRKTPEGLKFCERRVMYWRNTDCPWLPDGTQL